MDQPQIIDKLEQQRAKLTKKIKAEREKQRRDAKRLDDKRHAIIGKLLAEEADNKPNLKRTIDTLLHSKLTRKIDRALFGLPPLQTDTTDKTAQEK